MSQSIVSTDAVGVIADIEGLSLSDADREFIRQPALSGLIFFARNYQSPQQLTALTREILALRPDLLLCVDQEGGRVQRFREGFSRLPPMMTLEALYQTNSTEALAVARSLGWLMAYEVRRCGVHLSFAPVLDIERGCSKVIGDRAFGHSAEAVTALAGAFIEGMATAGMAAVGKHFPGHGAVVADSHLELPMDERSLTELETDLQPFRDLMAGQKIAGIMPAHVVYTAVDANHTAGFSSLWLQQILRTQMNFSGVIFSDDLTMAGAASVGSYAERALAAMRAGANALVVCNNRGGAQQVIDTVAQAQGEGQQPLSLQWMQGPACTVDDDRHQQAQAVLMKHF